MLSSFKQIIAAVLLLVFAATYAAAQYQNIEIANSGGSGYEPNEPYLAFSLQNPNYLVCGGNVDRVYISDNGGHNWSQSELDIEPYGAWGDPCVIADSEGNFYYFHLSNPADGSWIDRIVCQKSTDNGQTWEAVSYLGLNDDTKQDKETAVIDHDNGNIYIAWTQMDAYHSSDPQDSSLIMFARSEDQGLTWSEPIRISQQAGNSAGDAYMLRSASPAVGPNGELYIAWAGLDSEGNLSIMFDKSSDNGNNWLVQDIKAADFPGGSHFNIPGIYPGVGTGWLNMVCDTSGGIHNGTLYINWEDRRNGDDDSDIWLIKSTDGGESWTEPIRVNDDGSGAHQFFTRAAVDQSNGNLWIVFYDRRNYTDNHTDVYLAFSDDGSESFVNQLISESPFLPTEDIFFGDYNALMVHNGTAHPVWTRLQAGTISLVTTVMILENISENQHEFSETTIFPNPVNEQVYFSYKLFRPTGTKLYVCDITGQTQTIVSPYARQHAGKYTKSITPKEIGLTPGLYFFILETDKGQTVKKFIVQ